MIAGIDFSSETMTNAYEEPSDPDARKLAKALLDDCITLQDLNRIRAEIDKVGGITPPCVIGIGSQWMTREEIRELLDECSRPDGVIVLKP